MIEIKTRKQIPQGPNSLHAGQFASLAIDKHGYRAWGFGDTQSMADKDAISKVKALRARLS